MRVCVCVRMCVYVQASECERKEIYQRECSSVSCYMFETDRQKESESMRVCVKGREREKENMNVK